LLEFQTRKDDKQLQEPLLALLDWADGEEEIFSKELESLKIQFKPDLVHDLKGYCFDYDYAVITLCDGAR